MNIKVWVVFCKFFRIFNFEKIDDWYNDNSYLTLYRCKNTGIEKKTTIFDEPYLYEEFDFFIKMAKVLSQ